MIASIFVPVLSMMSLPKPLADVPMIIMDQHVFVSAKINGNGPYLINLDTGGGAGVSADLSEKLNLPLGREIQGGGVGGGTETYRRTWIRTVDIGGISLKNLEALIEPKRPRDTQNLTAGLGEELFLPYAVEFDYSKMRVRVYPSGTQPSGGQWHQKSVRFYNRMPMLECSVNGKSGWYTLDTGGGISMIFQRDFWKANVSDQWAEIGPRKVIGQGIGGEIFGHSGRIPLLDLDGIPLLDVPCTFSDMTTGSLSTTNRAGTIGQPILRQFNMWFDHSKERLYLSKNGDFVNKIRIPELGAIFAPVGNALYVGAVDPAGPSHGKLQRGDKVLAVNGEVCTGPRALQKAARGKQPLRIDVEREADPHSFEIDPF